MTKEKLSDLWSTPSWLFDKLHKEFKFDVDLCACEYNRKYPVYLTEIFDFNPYEHGISSGFMNPPYSNLLPFVRRAYCLSKEMKIVCLLKSDQSTKWWGIFWDFKTHQPKAGCSVRFLNKRVKFDPPPKHVLEDYLENGSEKDKKLAKSLLEGKVTTPAFPSAIVIMDRRFIGGSDE